MTLRTARPSRTRATPGSASAAASTASRAASAATSMVPRSLPFTCTARVTASRTSAVGSTAGKATSSTTCSAWPSTCHSAWQACGVTGLSISTIASRASWRTARPASLASSNFTTWFSSSISAAIAVLKLWRRP